MPDYWHHESLDAHNSRVAAAREAEWEYRRSLMPEDMIHQMQTSPSHEKLGTFNEVFGEILDGQVTIHGVRQVISQQNEMRAAYDAWLQEPLTNIK